ncbi:hypothetical protein [Niabella sp.]|uniref:hypothetical protein n=1 Tax=Niabella sp. TaxID=1962976 RepID=UPI0026080146|nr:hypothetical protein [Niabella sp.]
MSVVLEGNICFRFLIKVLVWHDGTVRTKHVGDCFIRFRPKNIRLTALLLGINCIVAILNLNEKEHLHFSAVPLGTAVGTATGPVSPGYNGRWIK